MFKVRAEQRRLQQQVRVLGGTGRPAVAQHGGQLHQRHVGVGEGVQVGRGQVLHHAVERGPEPAQCAEVEQGQLVEQPARPDALFKKLSKLFALTSDLSVATRCPKSPRMKLWSARLPSSSSMAALSCRYTLSAG